MSDSNEPELSDLCEKSEEVIVDAIERFGSENLGVTWTGGKDSTTMLWLIKRVCTKYNYDMPHVFTIDEGDPFPEIVEQLVEVSNKWNIDLDWRRNHDVLRACDSQLDDIVKVEDLNERNQAELEKIDFEEDEFEFEPENYAGNHLQKTVVLNQYIEEKDLDAMFMALRWDEQEAREEDDYVWLEEGGDLQPEHHRVEPILHFREKDIWRAQQEYNIPYCRLYEYGYRSLGTRRTSKKVADKPAWEQDLENTDERGGRRQDKEEKMDRLRDLGYM